VGLKVAHPSRLPGFGDQLRDFLQTTSTSCRRSAGILRWHVRRKLRATDARLIEAYSRQPGVRKLHIGCGNNLLNGWLNSDFYPTTEGVLYLDATKPFPFEDGVFRYVFSEHMIEHIDYRQGIGMLAECFRVLGPGGTVRVSTPDFSFLVALCVREKSDRQRQYIHWAIQSFVPEAPVEEDVFVVNNFVRNWGHRFIYSEGVLRRALESVGFVNVVRRALNGSDDDELKNLENEKRLPPRFLELETMSLEGVKASER
jgi:predicted SAM-dependent methyltransferase